MAREKCGILAGLRTVPVSWQGSACLSSTTVSDYRNTADATAVLWLPVDNVVHGAAAFWMVGRFHVMYSAWNP
jgi:cytochrome b subunit of formate dehydrogenase